MCATCTRAARKRVAAAILIPVFAVTHLPSINVFHTGNQAASSSRAVFADVFGVSRAHAQEANASPAPMKPQKFTCPMHPHYIADEFGTCPICGMDLVKLNSGDTDFGAVNGEQRAAITIAPEAIQNMGVRLGRVEQTLFGREVRSFGIVRANERLQTEITSRFEGWIEKLHVTAVGDEVKAGAQLFDVYSPQLVTSQNDYFLSRSEKRMADRAFSQMRSFGVQPQALEIIRQRSEPMQFVPFFAEQAGTVATLGIRQGSYVQRGTMLAMIQDYSKVWLLAGVSEQDLGFIKAGTEATVTLPNLSDRQVVTTVDYVYPTIDTGTRTGQVRLVIDNPDGKIRPGAYADVKFQVGSEERTAVPSEAVLRSGQGKYIVISLGQGRFQPRLIETGLVSGRWTEITQGAEAGEDVVVSGQFMLDSESALRESFQKLERMQMPLSLLQLSKNEFAMVDHFVDAGLYLHEALVDGFGVAPQFLDPAISVRDAMWPKFKNTKLSFVLTDAVTALEAAKLAKTESEVMAALSKLTDALKPWMLEGAPEHYKGKKVALFVDTDSKRSWAQLGGKPINPYGRGASQPIEWPAATMSANGNEGDGPAAATATTVPPGAPDKAAANTMKGSHSGH